MADEGEKRGFFARLFGRGGEKAPQTSPETEPAEEVAEEATEEAAEETAAAEEPLARDVEARSVDAPPDIAEDAAEPAPPAATTLTTPSPDAEATLPPELAGADLQPIETPPEPEPQPEIEAEIEVEPEPEHEEPVAALAPEPKRSWWTRLRQGLARTSSTIGQRLSSLFTKRKLDAATLEDLEDILIQADLGVSAASRIAEAVAKGRYDKEISADEVKRVLAAEVEETLTPIARPLVIEPGRKPFVILMVGVNGAGKTTTIGKLSAKLRASGRSVMLAAGDTFRAAAIEQLKVWGERTGAPVITRPQGSDAAGLAFDALTEAKARGTDVLLVDTAGRLQNKTALMSELEKVVRVMKKVDESAPHAVLLVLDATVGQNALSQVEIFGKSAGVTGLVMTKLDGTARGGILVALADKFALPVHYIGVGEGVDDLEPFTARDFSRAIAGLDER